MAVEDSDAIATGSTVSKEHLRRGIIGLPSAIVQAAAMVAPTAGIVATVAFIAGYAGLASPVTFAIGTVICLCIGVVVGEYARRIPTAGAFYSYLRQTFGPATGFVAGIVLAISYFVVFGFQVGFFSSFAQGLTASDGFSVPWQIFAVAMFCLSVPLAVFGVRPSLRLGLIALFIECTILFVVGLLIVAKGGASGNSFAAFNWSRSLKGQSGLWIAVVYTIFSFTGFESATTLGEEVKRPRRNIPLAVVGAVLVIGIFETFMSYAAVIGYGTSKTGVAALVSAPNPISSLAGRYGDSALSFLVTLAIVSSFTALNVVTVSALSRMAYSMSRDGLLPKMVGKLNRWRAPGTAAAVIGGSALALILIFGSAYGPEVLASWTSYFATLFWIVAYAFVVYGIVRFMWVKRRSEASWFFHGLVPLVAFGGIVWVGYGNVHPLPPAPLDYFIWATIAVIALIGGLAYWLRRNRPEIVEKAGYTFESVE
jgi:amino acid transporter